MVDKQQIKEWVIGLEAFRGHEPEEYYYLVEPLTKFVSNNGFRKMDGMNELVKAILTARPETTTTEIEPSVTAQLLADQIKPWIEDIRQTLFHSKSAPFSRIEDVRIWLDEAVKRYDEWHKRYAEWLERPSLIKEGMTFTEYVRSNYSELVVEEPTQQDEQVKVLLTLMDKAQEIARVTGFTVTSLEMYILADTSPVRPPPFTLRILEETHSLPSGTSILNRFARVTIRGELTFEELRSAYRGIRQELGIKRSKRPTTKHLQLYKMVRRRGDIPSRKGTVAFWKSVITEWNDLHPQDKYKTWKGIKLAYERIIAQFERRITTKGGQHERSHNQEVQE